MRIGGLSARPPRADDVAAALAGAVGMLGQRPAITALTPGGRREQGFASLSGWVAKGANLLALELGVGTGGRVAIAGPPGWPLAAVALSAWWVGATVVATDGPEGDAADVSVLHVTSEARPSGAGADLLVFGDELDGTGAATTDRTMRSAEQWTDAVTPHGDRPPRAAHDGSLVALIDRTGTAHTQRSLLAAFADDPGGALGIVRSRDEDALARSGSAALLAALALRPLVTGAATVVVADDDPARDAHEQAERIARWLT